MTGTYGVAFPCRISAQTLVHECGSPKRGHAAERVRPDRQAPPPIAVEVCYPALVHS
jgi:hypothetical protein